MALEALATAAARGPTHSASRSSRWLGARPARPPLDALCERFRAAVGVRGRTSASRPSASAGQQLVWRGEMDAGARELRRLLALADERGEPVPTRCSGCTCASCELRAASWDAAERAARRVGRVVGRRAADPADVRALPRAAGRGPRPPARPRSGRRGPSPAPAAAGVLWTGSRRCGRAGSRRCSHRTPARAADGLRPSGSTSCARASTSPACSRSRRSSSRRSPSSASSTRRARSPTAELAEAQDHPWARVDGTPLRGGDRARGGDLRRGQRAPRSRQRPRRTSGSGCASTPRGHGSRSAARSAAQASGAPRAPRSRRAAARSTRSGSAGWADAHGPSSRASAPAARARPGS